MVVMLTTRSDPGTKMPGGVMVPVRPVTPGIAFLTPRCQITMQKVHKAERLRDPQAICSIQ